MKLNGLEKYFKTNEKNEIEDFTQVNPEVDLTPLNFALHYNKVYNLYLNQKQFNFLIKKSNLKQLDNDDYTPIYWAFKFNKTENLNLNEENFDCLLKNSNLLDFNVYGYSPLLFFLRYKEVENINLKTESLNYLIDNSELSNIKEKKNIYQLKKIQTDLLSNKIIDKIDIKEEINKKIKI